MFTYLVTSYRNPEQLFRLLERLRRSSPDARLIVSHDRKSAPLDPGRLADTGATCHRTPQPVTWGDGSYLTSVLAVMATLELADDDWLTVLSGQDYPLRPLADYEAHLATCAADALVLTS